MTLLVVLAVLTVLALGYGILALFRLRRARAPTTFSAGSAPARPRDDVRFTVYRPSSVEPERWYELLVYAHRAEGPTEDGSWQPDLSRAVSGEAMKLLGDAAPAYRTATEDAAHPVVRETQLEFVPEIDGFQFNPPRIILDWTEELHRAHFRMKAEAALVGTTARGQLTIFNGPIILAQLALVVRVAETVIEEAPEPSVVAPYRRVFASYARTDADVVERVAEYARALGDEYLIDVTHIRAGEKWEPRIEELITQADVFQLFWSWNALASEYVQREWRYALSLGRPNFVRPVYWEDPLPQAPDRGLPPPELRSVHFQRVALGAPPGRAAPAVATGAALPPEFREVRLEDAVAVYSKDVLRPRPAPAGGQPPAPLEVSRLKSRRSRVPLATAAMLVLAVGAVGVFTQLSQTGSSVGAPPNDATAVDPTDVAPPAPPSPPVLPPSVRPVGPPTGSSPVIMVAAFDAPAEDPALASLAARLRDELVIAWNGPPMAAAPTGREPLEAAGEAGSRFVVTAAVSRAEGLIRIDAYVTDVSTGEVRAARSITAPVSQLAPLLSDALRETMSR